MSLSTETVIALFSSDARPLYKADVYRVLALPKGYILHFRYEKQYIHDDLLTGLDKLKGQPGQVYFVTGNHPDRPNGQRAVVAHPLRHVTIADMFDDVTINAVHFYLQMGEFSDARYVDSTPTENLPPNKFVSRVSLQASHKRSWIERVTAIAGHFESAMFFHIAAVKHKGNEMKPAYSSYTRSSHYNLSDEHEYEVDVSFYDKNAGTSGLVVDNSRNDVELSVPTGHLIGTEGDTSTFELHTHTLSKRHQIAYCQFKERDGQPHNQVELKWFVTRGKWKPWWFGIVSMLAAVGLLGIKVATDDMDKLNLTPINYLVGGVSLVLIAVAAGTLYWLFNKK